MQKTYDVIQWYVPLLNRLPKDHKFALGKRIVQGLYDLFEGLITAKYMKKKLPRLYELNVKLEILRYQTRMLLDFQLIQTERYEYAGRQLHGIGMELGSWIKQQQEQQKR
ncbi:four helix bundle protein [candidate division KSB3 bacterium]|nr:MAG: four helix bundle protein [candidate division KSB3 bacterium]